MRAYAYVAHAYVALMFPVSQTTLFNFWDKMAKDNANLGFILF